METVEEFKKKLIETYNLEIKMCWDFSTMFHEKGDMEMANMFVERRLFFEEIIGDLQRPGYF